MVAIKRSRAVKLHQLSKTLPGNKGYKFKKDLDYVKIISLPKLNQESDIQLTSGVVIWVFIDLTW